MPSVELDLTLSPDPDPDPETPSKTPEATPAFLLLLTDDSSTRYSLDPEPNPPALTLTDAETEAGTVLAIYKSLEHVFS